MVNAYYTYEGLRVWEDNAWDDVVSCIAPLCRWIEEKNKEQNKCLVSPGGEVAAPKGFNFKSIAPEEEAYWSGKKWTILHAVSAASPSFPPSAVKKKSRRSCVF